MGNVPSLVHLHILFLHHNLLAATKHHCLALSFKNALASLIWIRQCS